MHDPDSNEVGVIPELAGVIGDELLSKVKHVAQRVWIRVYGIDLVKQELPLIYAKWVTDETRAQYGALPLFINSWLQKAKLKPTEKTSRKIPLRITNEKCIPAWYDGRLLGCAVHATNEVCEIEQRT